MGRKRSMNVVNVTTMNDVIATKIAAVAIVEDIVAVLDRLTAHDMIGAIGAIGVIAEIGIVAVEETTITVVKKIEVTTEIIVMGEEKKNRGIEIVIVLSTVVPKTGPVAAGIESKR